MSMDFSRKNFWNIITYSDFSTKETTERKQLPALIKIRNKNETHDSNYSNDTCYKFITTQNKCEKPQGNGDVNTPWYTNTRISNRTFIWLKQGKGETGTVILRI